MVGLLLPVVLTSLAAALWVGSFAGLRRLSIIGWPWALGAIAIRFALFDPPIDRQPWAMTFGPWIWVATLIVLLAVLVYNTLFGDHARHAFGLAALGVASNLLVVVANGGYMPHYPEARLAAFSSPLIVEGAAPRLRNVVPSGPESRLVPLSDIIAQPRWLPMANVVSVGDLLLSAALAWWAFSVIVDSGPTQLRRQAADS